MATDQEKNSEETEDKKPNKKSGNFEITVEGYKCTLKPPNRFVIQAAMAKMIKTSGDMDMIVAGEIVFNSCKVKCDKEIEESDILLCSVFIKCFEIVEIKETELKKI